MVLKTNYAITALALSAALVSSACLDGEGSCSAMTESEDAGGLNVSFLQRGSNMDESASTKESSRVIAHHQTGLRERRELPPCAADWEDFGPSVLTRTQKVPFFKEPASFLKFESIAAHRIDQPFVSTEWNFGMCIITKVASTEWADIFVKIAQNDTSARHISVNRTADAIVHTAMDMRTVFGDPSSVTAVLVREPLSRFASAFIAKCSPNKTSGYDCFPARDLKHLEYTTMKDAVEWILEQDVSVEGVERHWGLQSNYCELYKRVQEYDYVLLYSKNHLAADASCLMEIAGIDRFNSLGPEYHNERYWQDVSETDEDEIENLKMLFTPEAARQVMKKFVQDYKTFHFAEPAWVDEASGRLYEVPIGAYVTQGGRLYDTPPSAQ